MKSALEGRNYDFIQNNDYENDFFRLQAKELCLRENQAHQQAADILQLKGDTLRSFAKVPTTPSHLIGYCSELMDNVNKALREAKKITREYLGKEGYNPSDTHLRNNIKLLNQKFSYMTGSKMTVKST